jgi:arginase family enzyme
MPLRMILDSGAVAPDDVALIGARALDPPEEEYIARSGLHVGDDAVARALQDVACVYVAVDADVLEPSEMAVFMPEPGGLTLDELEAILRDVAERASVLGAGFTGLSFEPSNVEPLTRLAGALRL